MNQHILSIASRYLFWAFLTLAYFYTLRGHNEPGGGFVGGLLLATSNIFFHWGYRGFGKIKAINNFLTGRQNLIFYPLETVLAIGLLMAFGSVLLPLLENKPPMYGIWFGEIWLPIVGSTKIGTPFIFDLGVCFVVSSVVSKIFFQLES